jgi:hypothetical protein
MMELALYVSQLRHLENLEEAMRPVDAMEIPGVVSGALLEDANGLQEGIVNALATTFLSQAEIELDLGRLYFGQEFCECLIPEPDEVRHAYYFARQMGWEFTYTTGYVTATGLAKTMANVAMLAEEDASTEILVNDWGVLRRLRTEYPNCRPVLGRLLTKQPRLARYTDKLPPFLERGIQTPEEEIRPHQIAALRETNLGISAYADLLRRQGVTRADLDPVPQGLSREAIPSDFALSIYAPWSCAATSRTCRTAAIADPRRQSAIPDTACTKPCRHLNRELEANTFDQTLQLRGNSAFSYNLTYIARYLNNRLPVDRLVFQPYIPI